MMKCIKMKESCVKNIILLTENMLDARDYERFGIDILVKNGFNVEVWDLTHFINPQAAKKVKLRSQMEFEHYYIINNYIDAKKKILAIDSSSFIVNFLTYRAETFNIYKCISKARINYCVLMTGSFPVQDEFENNNLNLTYSMPTILKYIRKKTNNISFYKLIKALKPNRLIDRAINYFSCEKFGILPARFVFVDGEKHTHHQYPIGSKTEKVWIHTLDYDIYLQHQKTTPLDSNSCVFLDEYYPFHSDYIYMGKNSPVTAEEYYPKICNFFNYIEQRIGIKILIAAHPRSRYEELPDYFDKRAVITGKTAEIVKNSRFIIMHSSTSINFAVLYRKPIIFITTNQIQDSSHGVIIDRFASFFKKKTINVDQYFSLNMTQELSINETAYDQYKEFYIKKNGTDELFFWQTVANKILEL